MMWCRAMKSKVKTEMTQQEVAKRLGISRQAVDRAERNGLKKLRKSRLREWRGYENEIRCNDENKMLYIWT